MFLVETYFKLGWICDTHDHVIIDFIISEIIFNAQHFLNNFSLQLYIAVCFGIPMWYQDHVINWFLPWALSVTNRIFIDSHHFIGIVLENMQQKVVLVWLILHFVLSTQPHWSTLINVDTDFLSFNNNFLCSWITSSTVIGLSVMKSKYEFICQCTHVSVSWLTYTDFWTVQLPPECWSTT